MAPAQAASVSCIMFHPLRPGESHFFKRHSSLCTSCLDLKRRCRNLTRIRVNRNIHAQSRQGTSNDAAREVEILSRCISKVLTSVYNASRWTLETYCLCSTQCFFRRFHTSFPVNAHATDRLEALVRQHEDAAVVGLQVVDLLAEKQRPEVFADELDAV